MLEQLEKDPSHACLFAYTPGPGAAASVRPAATANVAPQQRTQLEDLVKQFKDRPAANSSKEPTTSSEGKQPAVSEGKGGTQEHKPPVLTLKLAPEFRQYAGSKGQAETVRAVISLKVGSGEPATLLVASLVVPLVVVYLEVTRGFTQTTHLSHAQHLWFCTCTG
jgi:hypothetical protein